MTRVEGGWEYLGKFKFSEKDMEFGEYSRVENRFFKVRVGNANDRDVI